MLLSRRRDLRHRRHLRQGRLGSLRWPIHVHDVRGGAGWTPPPESWN